MSKTQRAAIFANGVLNYPDSVRNLIQPGDLLVAADGGARICRQLGILPHILIGDIDSLEDSEVVYLSERGTEIIHHPVRKDYTDLELALRHVQSLGIKQVIVLAALGARWDQTLANLLLPAAVELSGVDIQLVDGPQEVMLVRAGEELSIFGEPGDTVSLIPLGGDAQGVTSHGLEYPLDDETLYFGATRGLSNSLLIQNASVRLKVGLLLCVVMHSHGQGGED